MAFISGLSTTKNLGNQLIFEFIANDQQGNLLQKKVKAIIITLMIVFFLIYIVGLPDSSPLTYSQFHLIAHTSSSVIKSGQYITLTIELMNMGMTVDIKGGSLWHNLHNNTLGLSLGPCTENGLYGLSLFKGNLSFQSLKSSVTLGVWKPGIYNCPVLFSFYYYEIFGFSNVAALVGSPEVITLSSSITINGYWVPELPLTNNPWSQNYTFNYFNQGEYTFLVADGFGSMSLLHFKVI